MVKTQPKQLFKRLNRQMSQALEGAAGLCVQRSHYEVSIEHLLLKLMEDPAGDVQEILKHYEIEAGPFIKAVTRCIETFRSGNPGKPAFSPSLFEMLQEAWLLSSVELGLGQIRSGAFLLAIALNPSRTNLEEFTDAFEKINAEDLRKRFNDAVAGSSEEGTPSLAEGAAAGSGGAGATADPNQPKVHGRAPDSALAKFTIDFTAEAKAGKIDPIFERDREIRQMIDILARRRKNNPIIVGEAGTGKTALVEGLALRISQGDVPEALKNVELLSLDMGLLQAGAGMKGEFENRLKNVITEVKASAKPIILFIDEAHTVIGAGGAAGGSDAANLLKPALARGELRTIAATTWSEYKKYFERDPALARRFQVVKCDEPSEAAAVTMMRGLREPYEKSHKVRIQDDAVIAAAKFSARYISGRQLPDKAVDLLDTASARVKVSHTAKPNELDDAERKIVTIQREIDARKRDLDAGLPVDKAAIAESEKQVEELTAKAKEITEQWEREKELAHRIIEINQQIDAAKRPTDANGGGEAKPLSPNDLKALENELAEKQAALKKIQGKDPLVYIDVNPEIIAKVVGDWTGIPLGNMVRDEAAAILSLEDDLRKRIKGQDHALSAIAKGLRAAKAGISNPNTPLGVFLFVGTSGVGKTETALAVADLLFGGERFMCTINMSEFQEKHTVSRLVGSPPGYVGYGEGGVLTEAVRQRPYSVVLLDEVEKADLDVMNIFYQVFDKGMLADGEGRVIDFKNTVVFLTSNLATDEIMAATGGPTPVSGEELLARIRPILSKHFKPALLARMMIVPYFPLRGEAMNGIVTLKLNGVGKRLMRSHKMKFEFDQAVVDQIGQRCTEVETGARNIDHIINSSLLPKISSEILQRMAEGAVPDKLHLGLDENGEFQLTFSSNAPGEAPAEDEQPETAGAEA